MKIKKALSVILVLICSFFTVLSFTSCEKILQEVRLSTVKKQLIEENAPLKVTDLAIDGGTLILEGIQPTKIGELLNELWVCCVIDPRLNNEEWLLSQIRKKSN